MRSLPPQRFFIGRSADVEAVERELEEGRLVTLLGPGGIGKTSLALRFAHLHAEAYAAHEGGGAWFCDLSSADDLRAILSAVAGALGATLAAGEDAVVAEALAAAIARKGRVLVLLDNFDRIVEHAAATVGLWMRVAPSARFLATSRVALGVPGEQLWPLAPLEPADAVTLFTRRARQVRPTFDGSQERADVETIVQAIDRIPLAIELAAHRMAVLSTSQLLQRLEHPLDILASMRRTVLDSVDLLGDEARALFSACAIFRNGFTLDCIEAVLGDLVTPRANVLDALDELVRTSLVRVDVASGDSARYSFFETIRDVAEERAAAEPARAEATPRLTAYFAAVAARGGDLAAGDLENLQLARTEAVALARSRREPAHALEAVVLARALAPLQLARGLARTCAQMFDEALEVLDVVGAVDSAVRAELHLARGAAHLELGDTEIARAAFEKGRALAEGDGQSALAAVALARIGELSDIAGDTATAIARFDEALSLLARTPADAPRALREAETYLKLGHAHRREGDLARARTAIVMAADRYRDARQDEGLAWAMYELAVVDMFAAATAEALAHFAAGLEAATRGEARLAIGALTTARGCLLQDLGRLEEALEHHAEAARIFQETGARYREASALYYLATTYMERDEPAEARRILRRARALFEGIGAPRYEALVAGCLASALAASGELEAAADALRDAERAAPLVLHEPALQANVAIHRALFDRRRASAWDATAALERAEHLVASSPTDDSRFALRLLRAAIRDEERHHDALVVEPSGAWFRAPGATSAIAIPERSPQRRILVHLATCRIEAPGEVVTIDGVVAAGWPAEKIGTEAALNRAYVALAALRKAGLRDLLVRGGGGYALTQAVVVRFDVKGH